MTLVMLQVSQYYICRIKIEHVLFFPRNLLLIALVITNFQPMSSKNHLFYHDSFSSRSTGNTRGAGDQLSSRQKIIVEVSGGKSDR